MLRIIFCQKGNFIKFDQVYRKKISTSTATCVSCFQVERWKRHQRWGSALDQLSLLKYTSLKGMTRSFHWDLHLLLFLFLAAPSFYSCLNAFCWILKLISFFFQLWCILWKYRSCPFCRKVNNFLFTISMVCSCHSSCMIKSSCKSCRCERWYPSWTLMFYITRVLKAAQPSVQRF